MKSGNKITNHFKCYLSNILILGFLFSYLILLKCFICLSDFMKNMKSVAKLYMQFSSLSYWWFYDYYHLIPLLFLTYYYLTSYIIYLVSPPQVLVFQPRLFQLAIKMAGIHFTILPDNLRLDKKILSFQ